MAYSWQWTELTTEVETFDCLAELQGKFWSCRGQPKHYDDVLPKIDRDGLKSLSRIEKLKKERQSIDIFQETARFFPGTGESRALQDDIVALMALRHYGVPTRLLDWSHSPYVAAFFAVEGLDTESGEILSFDYRKYMEKGLNQWEIWGGDYKRCWVETLFIREEPPDWIACGEYPTGFPRQNAQKGHYTLTAQFGRDHASRMAKLLEDPLLCHRYVISRGLKPRLRELLRERHGVWRGSLFPDSAGAAETAKDRAFPT